MAFWQNLQFWVKNPINTWFNANFWFSLPKTTTKSNDYTYDSRYPWFDEDDYKKLERLANEKWVTGKEKTQLMDQLYQYYYPQVANSHKLDERQVELNRMTYDNDGKEPWNMSIKLSWLAQSAKQKYNIDASVNDNELLWSIVDATPNWQKLLEDYINNGNPEFLYAAWIEDRPQQWWVKNLINKASENDKSWGDKDLQERAETVTNYINLIWYWTEKLDEAANSFADKITVTWEWAVEDLKNKIDNMSQKEVEAYRKKYQEMLKDKDWRTAQVEWDNVVERLWNAVKWDLKYDYNEEDFMKWLIDQKSNLWEYMIGANDVLKWEHNPNVIKFFGNIPSSAVKTFTATVRGMTNPYDTLKWLYKIAATEEWHQAILNRYGSWDAFAEAMNTDPVWVADDILAVAELWGNIVSWWLKATWKLTWSESLTNAGNWVSANNVGSVNDALAQQSIGKLYGWLDKLADLSNNSTIQKANKILQTESNLQKMTDAWKQATKEVTDSIKNSAVWQAIKNYVNEWIDKLVWVSEEDRKFIRENKDLVNQYIDGKKSVEDVFDQVKTKIDDKRLANTEMWKEYETLRKNKAKVVNTEWVTADMKKELNKLWITIDKDWNLNFSKKINKFNAPQQKALQDAWEVLKDIEWKKKINAGNVLDTRQKMDDKLNWDGKASDLKDITAVDRSTENLIKKMRWVIDERAKTSVKWLKELDTKFWDAMSEMQQIKKDWLNPDWSFKDTARSKLRNLTKAWNEEKLARLEKVIPWITKDLQALDVWLTIDRATKQWVWQYAKNIWLWSTLAFAASWNIPAALVSAWVGILSTPKNFVRLIEAYPDIVEKLQAWWELLPSDMNRLQALATRLSE